VKRLVLFIAATALLLAACGSDGGSEDVAATVDDVDITTSDVEALAIATDEDLTSAEFAEILGQLIQWSAVEQSAAEEFGIEPTDDEVDDEVESLIAEFGQGATREEFLELQGISDDVLQLTASQILLQEALTQELSSTIDEPTTEDAEQAIADSPLDWTEVCAVHILVATEPEADEVLTRLDGGEDFAVVAQEVSLDTGSGAAGGDLGCASPAGYVAEFADATMTAEIGVVVGPVESQFGFHVIRVDERGVVPVEDVRLSLAEGGVGLAVSDWFVAAIETATVTVAEEYGTWQTDPFPAVVAPS
jgi:parvulin-like peptidyl-prolyl isomerase